MEIDKNKFQVLLFSSPIVLPFSFLAIHPWLVVNDHGSLSRWEVVHYKTNHPTSWGYLHRDFYPPFSGIEMFLRWRRFFWPAKFLGQVEGETAGRVAEFILKSPDKYPYCQQYSFFGPNSNTYVQWVLNAFPEFQATLPWNAVGKNYIYRSLES